MSAGRGGETQKNVFQIKNVGAHGLQDWQAASEEPKVLKLAAPLCARKRTWCLPKNDTWVLYHIFLAAGFKLKLALMVKV